METIIIMDATAKRADLEKKANGKCNSKKI